MLDKTTFKKTLFLVSFILFFSNNIFAHCDSMKGPVVKASQKALETGNINYVLIWIQAKDEKEINNLFEKILRVRKLNEESKEVADLYFFETVVRIHRMGEGEPYTGLKSVNFQPDKGIEAADIAVETGNLEKIFDHLKKKYHPKVQALFNDLQSKMNYDINNVLEGREYVAAYVHFIHFVEEYSKN